MRPEFLTDDKRIALYYPTWGNGAWSEQTLKNHAHEIKHPGDPDLIVSLVRAAGEYVEVLFGPNL